MLELDIGHTVVSHSAVTLPPGEITEEPTLPGESDPRTPSRAGAGEATRISSAGPDVTEDQTLATGAPGATHTPVTASGKTPPAQKKSGAYPTDNAEDLTGQTLNGLFVKKKLGAGGMGSVFLARQISLDRDVAVKVLPGQLAARPDFLARFTREALSAARLNHHNVIQVYDVGSLENVHYITMEFVQGASLGDLIRKEGKLDVETAAGYVLQAARGLHYAHRRGIIHRDIKPDNLMVNEHGVVKVADLGLAKMAGVADPESDPKDETLIHEALDSLTMVGTAMGTPSYMAPEQGKDASKVDHRADQYSLGCTLYYLCAGKTPFTGRTTFEIISKHATEPLVPLDAHVRNVPKQLSIIIERMLAKNAEDRYPSLHDVIKDIEAFLGVESEKGPYTPREEHMQLLEKQQKAFYQAPTQRKRQLATTGFFVGGAVLFLLAFFATPFVVAGAVLGILVLTPLINFIIDGVRNKRYLFRRVRSVFFGMTWKGWSATAMWVVLGLIILSTMGLLLAWIAVAFLAAGLAFAYQAMIVRQLERERASQLHLVQEMLKILRVRGISEEAIQDFVCRFTGENWEEFFEALFGYEAMLYYRERTSSRDKVKPRKRYATWRDPLARWLTEVEQKRRRAKEEAQIRKAESARLRSEGKSDADAEKEAKALAKEAAEDLGATLIIQPTETTPSKADIAVADRDLYRSSKKDKQSHGMVFWGFRLGRLAFALGILGAYALSPASRIPLTMQLPGFVDSLLTAWYNCGAGGSDYALVAGALLLVSVFSGRVLMPLLMTIGAFLMMTYNPLVNIVEQPNFDTTRAFWGGLLACVVGFVGLVFGKVGGGKF